MDCVCVFLKCMCVCLVVQFDAAEEEDDAERKPSRKQKSLGLLCKKFLALYPDYPPAHEPIWISLDEVATSLGERANERAGRWEACRGGIDECETASGSLLETRRGREGGGDNGSS